MSARYRPWFSVLCCSIVSACALGPDYARPELPVPSRWASVTPVNADTAKIDTIVQPYWWTAFGDPELDALLRSAIAANLDWKIAAAHVEQARAAVLVAAAPMWGTTTLQSGYDKTKHSRRLIDEPDAALRELGVSAPPNRSKRYSLLLESFYELDFWGRLRRSREAADAEFHATREDAHTIYLSLLTSVAGAYFDVRELDEHIALTTRVHDLSLATLKIAEIKYQAGVIAQTDVLRERAHTAQLDADVAELQRRRGERQHALAVLLGLPPGALALPVRPLRGAVQTPQVTPGLPSSLLSRRPDVRAAEYRLIAANARIGEAKAALFPAFSLTDEYGYQSRALNQLLSQPSRTWSFGPRIELPLLDGGRRRGTLQAARAATEQAVERYRLTLLQAYAEVENALSARLHYTQQQTQIALATSAINTAHTQMQRQYRHGRIALADVLDAERNLLTIEARALALHRAQLESVLFLYKALGGGWEQGALTDKRNHPDLTATATDAP